MTRLSTISPKALAALYSQQSDDTLVTLLTIYDPDTGGVLERLADNYSAQLTGIDYVGVDDVVYGVISRGENYIFLPLEITLPSSDDTGSSRAQLVIRDVTRYLTPLIRAISNPPRIKLELVLKSQPDVVEIVYDTFYLSNITYNSDQVTGELTLIDYQVEPFPIHSFTSKYFPGLF